MIELSDFPLITNQGTGLFNPTINTSLNHHMYYIYEIIYWISQFIKHTSVYNGLNKHIRRTKDNHCYVESPASHPSVTRLFWSSHPPPTINASASLGYLDARWRAILTSQVSPIQYLCQKSQQSMPRNMVKSGLAWTQVFRRRHLGRRVTAVTRIRWPTVDIVILTTSSATSEEKPAKMTRLSHPREFHTLMTITSTQSRRHLVTP